MDLSSCCICSLVTPSAPLSLSVLISFFHCLPTLLSVFDLLPLPPVFLVSLLTIISTSLTEFWLSLIRFLTPHPAAPASLSRCCFFFLVCVRLFPLDYVVRAPAVDYQSVDSQRAAKASSTNMRQYPNDWLVGSGPWKQASISA